MKHTGAQDVGDHVAVAAEQRLRRAHLGTRRELAFGEAVAPVLLVLGLAAVLLGTAGAERALVHLAAQAERAVARELRRAERARVRAVAAADADVLVVEDDAFGRAVEAVDRADRHARRVRAVHARDRDAALALDAVVHRDDAAAIHSPRDVVLGLARGDAAVAF